MFKNYVLNHMSKSVCPLAEKYSKVVVSMELLQNHHLVVQDLDFLELQQAKSTVCVAFEGLSNECFMINCMYCFVPNLLPCWMSCSILRVICKVPFLMITMVN